jgi:hypothetical protein
MRGPVEPMWVVEVEAPLLLAMTTMAMWSRVTQSAVVLVVLVVAAHLCQPAQCTPEPAQASLAPDMLLDCLERCFVSFPVPPPPPLLSAFPLSFLTLCLL